MAYRRRQGITKASDNIFRAPPDDGGDSISSSTLAAQAIRASAAHRDSSLSSAYADSAFPHPSQAAPPSYEYTSLSSSNEPGGFWGVLAKKARAILEDDNISQQFETPGSSSPKETQMIIDPLSSSRNIIRTTLSFYWTSFLLFIQGNAYVMSF